MLRSSGVVANANPRFVPCGDAAALVQAIQTANASASGGSIDLPHDCAYTLTSVVGDGDGLPVITGSVSIDGNGSTISRSSAAGTPAFRIFSVSDAGTLRLTDVNVEYGTSTEGAGILNDGTLAIEGGTVEHNTVDNEGEADAGGISNHGVATIDSATIADNAATSATEVAQGGGIATFEGSSLTIERATIKDNRATTTSDSAVGGGLDTFIDAEVTIQHTVFESNQATSTGAPAIGGAFANGSTTTVEDATFEGNTATSDAPHGFARGGAISSTGPLQVKGSKVDDNQLSAAGVLGGGIYTGFGMTLSGTDLTGNVARNTSPDSTAQGGGLYAAGGTTTVDEGAIVSNDAAGPNAAGGGIYALGVVELHATKVADNSPNQCRPLGKIAGCRI